MRIRSLFTFIWLLYIILIASPGSHAQARHVPKNIVEKLSTLFPGVGQVAWTKVRSSFRADFVYRMNTVSVTFNRDAEVVKSSDEIQFSALPGQIVSKIDKDYHEFKVLIVLRNFIRGRVEYEVELMKGKLHYALIYNEKYRLIHKYEIEKNDPYDHPLN